MVQAMRLTMAALVLCAAFVAPAVASRQLKQAGGIEFPGCSFLSDSVIARNPDYRALYNALQASGLNDTLSSLTSPYTIFAPTDYAFAEFLAAANITVEDALESSLNDIVLEAHIVPGVVSLTDVDMVVLPTVLRDANITLMGEEVNSTEVITVVSYASEATVVTPAAFACNLVIYGIDGVLVPEEAIYPFDSTLLSNYLTGTLMPGAAEVPLNLVVKAVEAGETAAVAEAALSAINGGYLQQLTDLYTQATGNQQALVALAAVGNEVIMMSSCATYTPVLQQLPSTEELEQAESTTDIVREAYPAFAECVESA